MRIHVDIDCVRTLLSESSNRDKRLDFTVSSMVGKTPDYQKLREELIDEFTRALDYLGIK